MDREQIENTINRFLVEEFEIDESVISPQASVKNDLRIDSLEFVDLAVFVSDTFGVKLQNEDAKQMHTLNDLYDKIQLGLKD